MVLMRKGNTSEYVPDVFVEAYRENGYKVDGEDDVVVNSVINPDNGDAVDEGDTDEFAEASKDFVPEKPKFVCPHCSKEYATQANLDKHIAEKHAE